MVPKAWLRGNGAFRQFSETLVGTMEQGGSMEMPTTLSLVIAVFGLNLKSVGVCYAHDATTQYYLFRELTLSCSFILWAVYMPFHSAADIL